MKLETFEFGSGGLVSDWIFKAREHALKNDLDGVDMRINDVDLRVYKDSKINDILFIMQLQHEKQRLQATIDFLMKEREQLSEIALNLATSLNDNL